MRNVFGRWGFNPSYDPSHVLASLMEMRIGWVLIGFLGEAKEILSERSSDYFHEMNLTLAMAEAVAPYDPDIAAHLFECGKED